MADEIVPSSYDIIGSREKAVAIIEIKDEEKGMEKEVAESIMEAHKNVESILVKESKRKGEYRTRDYRLVAGDEDTEVVHKEYGYKLKVDPTKVYFSAREGTERQRVAKQVKADELVMVMFSGIGPYPIAIGKKQPDVRKIIAIEINPDAVNYMKYNIRVNKLSHKIKPVLGDVRGEAEEWYGKCDRVVMPLPLGAEDFLGIAIKCAKDGAVIHFYSWGEEGELYKPAEKVIAESLKRVGREYKITGKRKVLPYSPGTYKVCVEFRVM